MTHFYKKRIVLLDAYDNFFYFNIFNEYIVFFKIKIKI